jgi:hypothetical protein
MSTAVRKNVMGLSVSIKKNLAKVERKFSSAGSKSSRAAVVSAAKYYSALSRLAKE